MPRKNPNKTNYHYAIKEFDDDGSVMSIKYYMTQYELMDKLGVSQQAICSHLRNEKHKFRNHKNIKIEKVLVPVYKKVLIIHDSI